MSGLYTARGKRQCVLVVGKGKSAGQRTDTLTGTCTRHCRIGSKSVVLLKTGECIVARRRSELRRRASAEWGRIATSNGGGEEVDEGDGKTASLCIGWQELWDELK